jgi:hypothetical protein
MYGVSVRHRGLNAPSCAPSCIARAIGEQSANEGTNFFAALVAFAALAAATLVA